MMKRWPTVATLSVWSGLLLWFWGSGRVVSYLHPQFHAYVAFAGFSLAILVPLWWWASAITDDGCGCCAGHAEDAPRENSGGMIFYFAVLLFPVTAAAFISPSQFGEAAVMNRGIVTDVSQLPSASPSFGSWADAPLIGDEGIPDVTDFSGEEGVEYFTRGPDGSIQLETIDLLFAADEPALREQFADQRVAIIGQYIPPRGKESGGFDLVRMFVVCCAADARPLGIHIESPDLVEVPRMGWVRITGVARFDLKDGRFEPRLEADLIEQVEAPRETFLY
jgi:uncharacterized repeat protein (TIGR03943 family)